MATPSKIESLTVGNRVFTDIANLKCKVTRSQGNHYNALQNPDATVYAPSGVDFHVYAVKAHYEGIGAASFGLLSCTTAVADSSVAGAGPIDWYYEVYSGAPNELPFRAPGQDVTSGLGEWSFVEPFVVTNGKFLHTISTTGGIVVYAFGYER